MNVSPTEALAGSLGIGLPLMKSMINRSSVSTDGPR